MCSNPLSNRWRVWGKAHDTRREDVNRGHVVTHLPVIAALQVSCLNPFRQQGQRRTHAVSLFFSFILAELVNIFLRFVVKLKGENIKNFSGLGEGGGLRLDGLENIQNYPRLSFLLPLCSGNLPGCRLASVFYHVLKLSARCFCFLWCSCQVCSVLLPSSFV